MRWKEVCTACQAGQLRHHIELVHYIAPKWSTLRRELFGRSLLLRMHRKLLREAAQRCQGLARSLEHGNGSDVASGSSTLLRALSSRSAGRSGRGLSEQSPLSAKLNQPLAEGFSAVPAIPKFLGLAGALPFLALSPPIAAGIPLMPADLVASAALLQVGYGATIASFLGGIHWALAMANYGRASQQANADRYLWSVTPCLMAWPAVIMQPGPASLVVGSTLGVAYMVDRSFAQRGLMPSWYMALRLPLTLAAVGGLVITCTQTLRNPLLPEQSGSTREAEQD